MTTELRVDSRRFRDVRGHVSTGVAGGDVLSGEQENVCLVFAVRGSNKFTEIDWPLRTPAGVPVLPQLLFFRDGYARIGLSELIETP